jgi:2-succinyl-6-hydroxy-2,4-cyclohexadiene-1-carboxylate synthase
MLVDGGHDGAVRVPTVLLHGFTNTGASWDPVRAALAQRYTAVAPDLRGHGSAAAARPVDLAGCVADVAALAPGPFGLCGYSMGGRVALHVALVHPDRVAALVLVGASPGIADDVEREARRDADEALARDLERDGLEAFAARWERQPIFKGQSAGVVEAARADRLRNDAAGLAAALRALGQGAMAPVWGRLDELVMPVSLCVGERDVKYRRIADRMAARIPDADVIVLPAVGHAAHLEAPKVIAAAIEQTATRAGLAG